MDEITGTRWPDSTQLYSMSWQKQKAAQDPTQTIEGKCGHGYRCWRVSNYSNSDWPAGPPCMKYEESSLLSVAMDMTVCEEFQCHHSFDDPMKQFTPVSNVECCLVCTVLTCQLKLMTSTPNKMPVGEFKIDQVKAHASANQLPLILALTLKTRSSLFSHVCQSKKNGCLYEWGSDVWSVTQANPWELIMYRYLDECQGSLAPFAAFQVAFDRLPLVFFWTSDFVLHLCVL